MFIGLRQSDEQPEFFARRTCEVQTRTTWHPKNIDWKEIIPDELKVENGE